MKSKLEKNNNKGGRNYDYDINDTEKWFNELSKKKEYQHSNNDPYLKKIDQRLIELHKNKVGTPPSIDTIKNHRRKLGLTQKNIKKRGE